MAWSAGTFTRTYGSTGWQGDAAVGTPIVADRHDTNDQDLANGINSCLNKDGSNSMTANLNFGGFIPSNTGAGNAAAPTYCAGNDQDTGLFSAAANEIGIATNGVERIRIGSTGNLGIGTSTPSVALDILGVTRLSDVSTDATNKVGRVRGRSYTNAQGDWLALDVLGLSGDNQVRIGGGSGSLNCATSITFLTAANTTTATGTERMRITSAGFVGIGTASPSAKFTVDAAMQIGQSGTASNNFHITAEATGALQFWNGNYGAGTERMRLTSGGNLGLGVTPTSYQLQLSTDTAGKLTTNTWTITSDKRVKTNIAPYTKGLADILQVEPITYDYNGKGGIPAGPGGVSILAQDLQPIFPECVGSYKGKLGETDEEETDILNYNGHAMTFALINAVKELSSKLDNLTKRVEALEA